MTLPPLRILFTLIMVVAAVIGCDSPLKAQVTGVYSLEVGGKSARGEYLSPIAYSGTDFALSGYWTKCMNFNPEKAMMAFEGRAALSRLLNPAGSAAIYGCDARFSWQMRWMKRLPHNLTLTLGGGPAIDAGALALLRNSNNPVDVTVKFAVEAAGSLSWRHHFGRLPVVFEERFSTPLVGAFFMPQYGETFYEIYLGNHKRLAHFGYPGNFPGLQNMVSLSMDFGSTALFVGYRLGIGSAFANNLSTKQITNGVVIGVIPHGLGIRRKPCGKNIRPY